MAAPIARVLVLGSLGLARASFVPRPLRSYNEAEPQFSSEPGVRRFWHREAHALGDGTDIELHWEVEANPDTILALDLEHPTQGIKLVHCEPSRLVLEAPTDAAQQASTWRHVTASESRHGCWHLGEKTLYHRIAHLQKVTPLLPLSLGRSRVELSTKELPSAAHVFPYVSWNIVHVPGAVKADEAKYREDAGDVEDEDEVEAMRELASPTARRLTPLWQTKSAESKPLWSSNFQPDGTAKHNSMFNLDIPEQVSNMAGNWDYNANSTGNPQFRYDFPGGVGWMRLYKPYWHSHFALNVTFRSSFKTVWDAPKVNVTGLLKGYARFNADVATAVNFKKDRSAAFLPNVMQEVPILRNLTSNQEKFFRSMQFYLGGTEVTVKPGFSCELKAYHIGLLQGTLRVGLSEKLRLLGTISFDTNYGLLTNISAKALDVRLTPPTWMLFTRHFEMGVMLQPTLWMKGGFGQIQDMEMGFALRPYFNMSIMQKNAIGATASDTRELAIYPWRVVGLPGGKNYAIRVGVLGQFKSTSTQMSTGVAEYTDNVEDFSFGMVQQDSLIGAPIQIEILENGKEPAVATGSATCASVVNGMCTPNPQAKMDVDGKQVTVDLSIVWHEDALTVLTSKIKSISLRFPAITVSDADLAAKFEDANNLNQAQIRLSRNGRSYAVPLTTKMKQTSFLKSRVIIELGPSYLDAWKGDAEDFTKQSMGGDSDSADPNAPTLELLIGSEVVGKGTMPPVQWDQTSSSTSLDVMADRLRSSVTPIPVMVPLYADGKMVGTGEMEIDVMPAHMSAFWVYPDEAQDFEVGKEYNWSWATNGAEEGVAYNFTLTAQLVLEDGSLRPTRWQKPVQVACTKNFDTPVKRYHGSGQVCAFVKRLPVPDSLIGKRAVMTALWLDARYMPHEMLAAPVSFVKAGQGRRLDGALHMPEHGITETRLHDVADGYEGVKKSSEAGKTLAQLRAHCNAQDLKYSVDAGVNFVEHLKNFMMPSGMGPMGVSGLNAAPDWTSEPVSLFKLGNGPQHGKKLQKLLPNAMCSAGACEGMLPGCQRRHVNPINIKQVILNLSRLFKWKDHVGPKMRHIVAYALALLPSAIQISHKQVSSTINQTAQQVIGQHPELGTAIGMSPVTQPTTAAPAPRPRQQAVAPAAPAAAPTTTGEQTLKFTSSPTTQAPVAPSPAAQSPTQLRAQTQAAPKPAPASPQPAGPAPAPAQQAAQQQPGTSQEPQWYGQFVKSAPAPAPGPKPNQWYTEGSGSFESGVDGGSSSATPARRLLAEMTEAERNLAEIEGPASLDGEDVMFDTFKVTIVSPMEYELTEELLRTVFSRGGFRGISDGREDTHGPIEVVSFSLIDPPLQHEDQLLAPRPEKVRIAEADLLDMQDLFELELPGPPGGAAADQAQQGPRSTAMLTGLLGTLTGLAVAGSAVVLVRGRVHRYRAVMGSEPLQAALA